MVLLRQHAEEYGVTLTAEEEEQIDKVAQAYIDENSEDVRAAIGASKENVIELLELQLIKSKMLEPMAADVDTEVSDEEAQQSGVTYVKIDKATEDDFADENSDESSLADSSVADSVDVTAQVEAANAEKLSQAEAVLAAVQASGNVAEADMTTIANEVNKDFYAQTGQFTTFNTEDTVLDMAIVEAVAGLADGTLVDHVVESSDGTAWFVVRFDAAYDEAATEEIKKEKVTARKQEAYDTLYTEWKDAAKITVDEAVLATLIISDMNPITFGKDVLPAMLNAGERMFAYPFEGYWKDVGTIDSLWEANMDLLDPKVTLDLKDIYSRNPMMPPHYVSPDANIQNSLIADGCEVEGNLEFSILFSGVTIGKGATINSSIIMPGAVIEDGATVQFAIVAENTVIGKNAKVGQRPEEVENRDNWGIAVIGENTHIAEGAVIKAKEMIDSETEVSGK